MNRIPDRSVDMILCDLPFGTTQLKWDRRIAFAPLWKHYERIIKDKGVIILIGSQPFTTDIICSNRKLFRYEIIWEKTMKSGFFDANNRPLKGHENILVFYKQRGTYNPQKTVVVESGKKTTRRVERAKHYNNANASGYKYNGTRYPTSVIKISNWHGALFGNTTNATKLTTQKPVPLFSYLIKTFTNPGDLVLDNCIGSGTTAISCMQEGRNFIGFELKKATYKYAIERINREYDRLKLNRITA
jgi:site-specific DNA-methyltransferase (adenine-specific)